MGSLDQVEENSHESDCSSNMGIEIESDEIITRVSKIPSANKGEQ